MIYSIPIYPKGRDIEKHPKVCFPDKEVKEAYTAKEELFCRDEYNKYLTAHSNSKKEAQKELDNKRILFAKQQNYAPKKSDKFMWVLQESTGGDGDPKLVA